MKQRNMRRIILAIMLASAMALTSVPAAALVPAFPLVQDGKKFVSDGQGQILLTVPAGEYTVITDAHGLLFEALFSGNYHDCRQNFFRGETLVVRDQCGGIHQIWETDSEGNLITSSFSLTFFDNNPPPPPEPSEEEEETPPEPTSETTAEDEEGKTGADPSETEKPLRMILTGGPSTTKIELPHYLQGVWRIRNFKKVEYKLTAADGAVCLESNNRPRKMFRPNIRLSLFCAGPLTLTVIEPTTDWRIWITKVD